MSNSYEKKNKSMTVKKKLPVTELEMTAKQYSPQAQSASDALAMQLVLADPAVSDRTDLPVLSDTPTHVVRLSCDTLCFNHTEQLEQTQKVWLIMRLDSKDLPVVTEVEVVSSNRKSDHSGKTCFDTCVRFTDDGIELQSMIQSHIDSIKSKMYRFRREYTYVPGGLGHTAA